MSDVGDFIDNVASGEFLNGVSPAENWNWGAPDEDSGLPVYATAPGEVIDVRLTDAGNPEDWGYRVILRHFRPDGSIYYSLYLNVVPYVNGRGELLELGEILDSQSGNPHFPSIFPFSIGDFILRGLDGKMPVLGRIGAIQGDEPTLHFEIRKTEQLDPADPWPSSEDGTFLYKKLVNGIPFEINGLFADRDTAIAASQEIFGEMGADGVIDPSDFIDTFRPTPAGGSTLAGATISYSHERRVEYLRLKKEIKSLKRKIKGVKGHSGFAKRIKKKLKKKLKKLNRKLAAL